MRRLLALTACAAALTSALPAAAALQPLQPRPVRADAVVVPKAPARVEVIVRLRGAPTRNRSLATRSLEAAQARAIASLRRAIPEARVGYRYQVVFNGFAVEVPARRLPQLLRLSFVDRVYPSIQYTQTTNRSPDVIGAAAFATLKGARGEGMKIAIVDDGVDPRNPFLSGAGYSPPPGFPKGGRPWTNGKIIVARAFPHPNSGRQGRLAFVPRFSFHGTHVAGIAAGNAGTTATAGPGHPRTPGLSGVAPRAFIGNYRVFNDPSPIGFVAGTPAIIKAFEAAVEDGMDVVNFSGGGIAPDPANDALVEAVANVAAAGVVPVISSGNDRDEFGLGSAGTPGTAPEAIAVAATSNEHVFAHPLRVTAPGAPESVREIPLVILGGIPAPWSTREQTLVDVGTIADPRLCAAGRDPNDVARNPLPRGSLTGAIALVSRGVCSFASKAARAAEAGAVGLILVDNRFGEANPIPLDLNLPAGMIADEDGAQLRAFMATTGGRTTVRIGGSPAEIATARSGVITSFSSAGPTPYEHLLKPDVSAPGHAILSSTSPESAGGGSPFAVFDGTSMSAPHVAGAAALLAQRHPSWTPQQVKSALMSTAAPAWGNTERTVEAPVLLEGAGLVNLVAADEPKIFTAPQSLSFGFLNVNRSAQERGELLRVTDAGGGDGAWSVELRPQSASAGATITVAPVVVPSGGTAHVSVVVAAPAGAAAGDNYGFVVLRRGDVARKIPYYFSVTRPALESKPAAPLRIVARGDTRTGVSLANRYRFPNAPFGPAGNFVGPPMNEDGAEDVYTVLIDEPVVNFGAAVVATRGGFSHPWLLGSKDENDVWGGPGTPVNVNAFMPDYLGDVAAAGSPFPRPKRYYFSVDAGRDPFTDERLAGGYTLRTWRNDVHPPVARLVSTRVSAGYPLVVVRVRDAGPRTARSGIDPYSLVLSFDRVSLGASFFDPVSGIAIFDVSAPDAPSVRTGATAGIVVASDNQETKNIATPGGEIFPNTSHTAVRIRAVDAPTVTWIEPDSGCVARRARLVVAATSTRPVRAVTFFADGKRVARVPRRASGLYATTWRATRGTHALAAVVVDAAGRSARATRTVRVCG